MLTHYNTTFPVGTRPRLQQLLTFDQTEFFYGYSGPEYMDSQGKDNEFIKHLRLKYSLQFDFKPL